MPSEADAVYELLLTCMEHVKKAFFIGTPNKIKDVKDSQYYSLWLAYRLFEGAYQPYQTDDNKSVWRYKQQPNAYLAYRYYSSATLTDSKYNLPKEHIEPLGFTLLRHKMRASGCDGLSMFFAKTLWERATDEINQIEVVEMTNYDHTFVIVNGKDSWDENTWIVDVWHDEGLIYPAKEYETHIKGVIAFAENQANKIKEDVHIKIDIKKTDQVGYEFESSWLIKPQETPYPYRNKNGVSIPLESEIDIDVVVENDIKDPSLIEKQKICFFSAATLHRKHEAIVALHKLILSLPEKLLSIDGAFFEIEKIADKLLTTENKLNSLKIREIGKAISKLITLFANLCADFYEWTGTQFDCKQFYGNQSNYQTIQTLASFLKTVSQPIYRELIEEECRIMYFDKKIMRLQVEDILSTKPENIEFNLNNLSLGK